MTASTTDAAQFRTRDGKTTEAIVNVMRFGRAARLGRSGGVFATGLGLGVLTLPVPGVHLVMPWLLPLLAAGVALYVWKIEVRVEGAHGLCPKCEAAVSGSHLRAVTEAGWLRCPGCGAPVELVVS